MKIEKVGLGDVTLITLDVFRDQRGFFTERFHTNRFEVAGLPTRFFQDNHSRSLPGVLRGLHYQVDPAQGKLVGALRGRIWDAVVDIRPSSSTFGNWYGTELSDENGCLLWVPQGFAHGFCVLGTEPADVLYKVDNPYVASNEGGLLWNDRDIGVRWPLEKPFLSDRDQKLESFASYRARSTAP